MTDYSIEGLIGTYDITNDALASALFNARDGLFTLHLNSYGGAAPTALQMHQTLEAHPGKIRVEIGAMVAGSAILLAMAGDEIVAHPNSVFHLCELTQTVEGNAEQIRWAADQIDAMNDQIGAIIGERIGRDIDEVVNLMVGGGGTWLTAQKALEFGLCTEIAELK